MHSLKVFGVGGVDLLQKRKPVNNSRVRGRPEFSRGIILTLNCFGGGERDENSRIIRLRKCYLGSFFAHRPRNSLNDFR